jgi:hypothetical protein
VNARSGLSADSRLALWPWSAKVALLVVPTVLLVLLVAVAIIRAVAGWPTTQFQGWVLLAIVVLSLLPVILLLAQAMASRGGTLQLPGLSLSFASVSQEVASSLRTTTLAENLGTPDNAPVYQSSMPSILRALRRARDSEATVIDLRRGHTWWETRLFLLVAGAARRDRPQAIAFIADRNGKPGAYLGWAPPSRLLDRHMTAVPEFGEAYNRALSSAAQWQIGMSQPGTPPSVKLPWNNAVFWLPPMMDESPDPEYALELFLQQDLDGRPEELRRFVTIQRLLELYEPVLMTDSVDVEADDAGWARLLASNPRRYFGLTATDTFKALVPRDSLLAVLVARMIEAGRQNSGYQ